MRTFTISASTYHFASGDWGEFQNEKPFILRNCHSVIPFPFPFPDSGFLVLVLLSWIRSILSMWDVILYGDNHTWSTALKLICWLRVRFFESIAINCDAIQLTSSWGVGRGRPGSQKEYNWFKRWLFVGHFDSNKMPKVVSVGCVGLWKHNGVLSRLMEQNKTKHLLALSRVEPRVTKFDKVPMF